MWLPVCVPACLPACLSRLILPTACVACLRIRQAAALIQSVETGREGLFEGQIYLFTKTIIAITIVVRRRPLSCLVSQCGCPSIAYRRPSSMPSAP